MFTREAKEFFNLRRSEIGGSAASPVKLHDGAITGNAATDVLDLSLQYVQVRGRDTLVFLDDDIARAEEAETLAKRDVHVERHGRFGALGFFVNFFQVSGAEGIIPDGRGGVAGVPGTGTVVACEKFFADAKLVAHVFEAWMCERHDTRPLTPICCWFGFLQQRLLAGFDKKLSVLHWRVLEDAVAEVQNVACSAEC
jgi:hypothetical protein